MGVLIVIALRNAAKNKRRSILIGSAICLSTFLLLLAGAIGNGSGAQIMHHYKDFWAGDVVVAWKEVKQYGLSDPSRLFYSTFHAKEDNANREALRRLVEFIDARGDRISAVLHSIKSPGTLDTGALTAWVTVTGVEPEEYELLVRDRYLVMEEGETPFSAEYGICISRKIADDCGITLGSWPAIDVTTKDGYTNTFDYEVTGIYRNSSEFDGVYVYMSRENALDLLDWDSSFSSTVRIFLKDPDESQEFAASLDAYLLQSSDVLRAESFAYTSYFFSLISVFVKSIFTLFVFFLLFIIALGMRSAVRMNLFERQAEFGTLRAIGFGRGSAFALVFFEIFALGIAAGGAALVLSAVLVTVLSLTGVPTGPGPLASVIGGESVFPVLYLIDVVTAFSAIAVFSAFASLKPGLRLCCQKITDLLNQDQKPLFAVVEFFKQGGILCSHHRRRQKLSE